MNNNGSNKPDNWVRIFISHKEEDKELAFADRDILESGCTNLRCYVSGSGYSHDWLATIRTELRQADVLLLLFTSPAKQWDWPLYEVGLFTPIDDATPERTIIYLYAGEQRPAPLEHLQGVRVDPANLKTLESFLSRLYKTADITRREPPLHPRIKDRELHARAEKLCAAFMAVAAEPLYPTFRIALEAPREGTVGLCSQSHAIPRTCRIKSITPPTLSIFGFAEPPSNWGEILDAIDEDVCWKGELDGEFIRAASGRVAYPTSSTFRGVEDDRNFRAMITKLERADTRILRIVIAFIPEHTPAIVGGPAFNLLRMATRFQTEVIQRFGGHMAVIEARLGRERAMSVLLGALRNIERESEQLRFSDPATVCSAFSEDNDDRATVSNLFAQWAVVREELVDQSAHGDTAQVEHLLERMRHMNMTFLRMIAKRHCELIERDAKKVLSGTAS